jgi:hypothetical protein
VRRGGNDHQGQGLSGEWRAVLAGGVGLARPLSRRALTRTRRRRRAAVPATRGPVVAHRYAPFGTADAHSARVRLDRPGLERWSEATCHGARGLTAVEDFCIFHIS